MPTPAETEAILAQASPAFRLIYSALRQCGARPGELCRATIADVDRANRVITLKEHKTARKTGQPRRIPIGRKLGELLDQAIGDRTEGPVFLSPSGTALARREPQPDVFPAAGHGRPAERPGAVPGPPRVRDEDLPREGDRVRPPTAGAHEHLDDAAVHAPGRRELADAQDLVD